MSKYSDEYIKHLIALEFYGNELADEAVSSLSDLEEEIEDMIKKENYINTKSQVNDLDKKIKEKIAVFMSDLEELVMTSALNISGKEADWFTKNIEKYLAVSLTVPATVSNLLKYTPYSERNTIQSFLSNTELQLKNIYNRVLKTGYVFGNSSDELINGVKSQTKALGNSVQLETQTMGSSFAKNTDRIILNSNKRASIDYVWVAILDSSTCIVCGELNGTRYASLSDAPIPPIHLRCRCICLPELKSEPIETETYSNWISHQSESDQLKILGRTRYNLYKQGMSIDHFVNDGRKLTLDEIYSNQDIQ